MGILSSILKDLWNQNRASARENINLPQGFNDIRQCRHGLLMFNRHDIYVGGSIGKYGEFSENEAILFRRIVRPGMQVIEVGANIGAHTVELSRLVGSEGSIHAFEPQRLMFQCLCANLALNQCGNVFAYQVGVGDRKGEIYVPKVSYESSNNFGGLSLTSEKTDGEKVALERIDDLHLPGCDFLKIDVEGMECDVLEGARETIGKFRPIMYVENDRENHSKQLIELVMELGYRAWWHLPPLFSPENYFSEKENIFPGIVSINMLCLPQELDNPDFGLVEVEGATDTWKNHTAR